MADKELGELSPEERTELFAAADAANRKIINRRDPVASERRAAILREEFRRPNS
jgi:hypothetical protein